MIMGPTRGRPTDRRRRDPTQPVALSLLLFRYGRSRPDDQDSPTTVVLARDRGRSDVEGLPGRRLENLERWVERESGDVGGLAGERTDAGAFFAHNGTMTETNEVRTLRVDRRREVTGRFLR